MPKNLLYFTLACRNTWGIDSKSEKVFEKQDEIHQVVGSSILHNWICVATIREPNDKRCQSSAHWDIPFPLLCPNTRALPSEQNIGAQSYDGQRNGK